MRYLSIDFGTRRCGLAVCDNSETLTSPFAVLEKQKLLDEISKIIESEKVDAIVIGLPLNMDGSAGRQAQKVRNFAEQIKKITKVPVYFQDERLSTFSAAEKLSQIELPKNKKKNKLDAIAAAQILEAFLEVKKAKQSQQKI